MRLIDADELLEDLARACIFFGNNEKLTWDIIEDTINRCKTIGNIGVFHFCPKCGGKLSYRVQYEND